MDITKLINLRNILLSSIREYNTRREEISAENARLITFNKNGEHLVGTFDLDMREHPDLFRKTHEAEEFVQQIIEMYNDGAKLSRKIEKEFPKAVKKVFPGGDFTMTFELPSENEMEE